MRFLIVSLTLALSLSAKAEVDYQGLWWVSHGDGAPLQIRLYPDGRAWSDYPANNPGRWKTDGDKMICVWADDWKEVFRPQGEVVEKLGFEPGVSLGAVPSNVSRAYKATISPDGWFGPSPQGFVKP